MKLEGPNGKGPRRSSSAPKSSASAAEPKSVSEGPKDSAPPDLLESSFKLLAAKGRRAATFEPERIRENLKQGYEALVQFKNTENNAYILPVRQESELLEYAALMAGSDVDPEIKKTFANLRTSSKFGTKYYYKRGGQYLKTDAAGATLGLKRGSRVVIKRGDGEYSTFKDSKTAIEFLKKIDGVEAQTQKSLERAEKAGLSFAPVGDDSKQPATTVDKLLQAFSESRRDELEMDKRLAESLESTGKLAVSFDDDERPLPLPLHLSADEIKVAAKWADNPTPEIKNFKQTFSSLQDKKMVLMTQAQEGDMKGMVVRADDRAAYFQLKQGERVVALDGGGDVHEINNLEEFQRLADSGRVTPPDDKPFDGRQTDSDNLLMVYHVSPFDPIEKGNYDDLPQRLTDVGSSEQVDIVTLRSDLPTKSNLRYDRVQKGEMESLATFDPKLAMSDPKVLEDFVYHTVRQNLGDGQIRFMVGGHGGAEKGLLPDGEHNNSAADHAMPVDKFAKAISKGLDRVEKETGERPKIANLMLVSCLMGNTSFINALAKTGDIESLIASPELMAGSNPISTVEYLANPETSKASAHDYAKFLVDEWSEAPAMIGGNIEHRHADTIGAYDLSPEKAERFEKALNGFFDAAVAEPKYAEYLKENIAKAPTYGINPIVNVMFDVDNRDLLQVLDSAGKDARIKSPKLKEAMEELKAATEAQVISQKVSENYEGRRGPSLYLPLDEWDFNEKMTDTELLKGGKYHEFLQMIFQAPLQRTVAGNLVNEVSRLSETGVLDDAMKKMMDTAVGKGVAASVGGSPVEAPSEEDELLDLHALEETVQPKTSQRIFDRVGGVLKGALALTAGVAAGAVGGVVGAGLGLYRGAIAGWRGVSASDTHKPTSKEEMQVLTKAVDELLEENGLKEASPDKPEIVDTDELNLKPLKHLWKGRVAKGLHQLLLWPAESTGIKTHEAVGRKYGEIPGRVAGAVTGAVSGAFFNTLAMGAAGFVGGGVMSLRRVGGKLEQFRPEDRAKPEVEFEGRFEGE